MILPSPYELCRWILDSYFFDLYISLTKLFDKEDASKIGKRYPNIYTSIIKYASTDRNANGRIAGLLIISDRSYTIHVQR